MNESKVMAGHHRAGDEMEHVHRRLNGHDEAIALLMESHRKISTNMEILAQNIGRVAEVLEAFNNAKGFWLTIKFLSTFAKVLLPVLIFAGVIWVFLKTGQWVNPK